MSLYSFSTLSVKENQRVNTQQLHRITECLSETDKHGYCISPAEIPRSTTPTTYNIHYVLINFSNML